VSGSRDRVWVVLGSHRAARTFEGNFNQKRSYKIGPVHSYNSKLIMLSVIPSPSPSPAQQPFNAILNTSNQITPSLSSQFSSLNDALEAYIEYVPIILLSTQPPFTSHLAQSAHEGTRFILVHQAVLLSTGLGCVGSRYKCVLTPIPSHLDTPHPQYHL
jgi:hypothetical protein